MQAVAISHPGDVSSLVFETRRIPSAKGANLVVRVRAIGINRADSLQRQGLYPMPPGLGNVPGLELAGEVEAIGPDVQRYKVGDRVFALVAEGAYAEYCLVDEGLALPIPPNWNFAKAAAVMEVACTTNETVFELGALKAEQTVLVHAGASGVGTTAIQMAKSVGAKVLFTAGSQEKIDLVCSIGGDMGINYHAEDFVDAVTRAVGNRGVDLIQDLVGGDYLMRNINLLRTTGRLVLVGALRGARTEFDIGPILKYRLKIFGFTLRAQTLENKRQIVNRIEKRWLPKYIDGTIEPIIHSRLPFSDVRNAHLLMDQNVNFGKLILEIN